jgi:hypothetical protein
LLNDLFIPVHFEVGYEFCFLDQLLLVLLELELFFSQQGFPSWLADIAGETLELSLEPAIEVDLIGLYVKRPYPLGLKCDTITSPRRLVTTFLTSNSTEFK